MKLSGPRFYRFDCQLYRLAALLTDWEVDVQMLCARISFAFKLSPGTTLFPVDCNIAGSNGEPLYVSANVMDVQSRPKRYHIPVYTEKNVVKIDNQIKFNSELMSFYDKIPGSSSGINDTEWELGNTGILLLVLMGVIMSAMGVAGLIYTYIKRRKPRDNRIRHGIPMHKLNHVPPFSHTRYDPSFFELGRLTELSSPPPQ